MKVVDKYVDTDGTEHVYFTDGLANGPTIPMFVHISCSICTKSYINDSFIRLTHNGVPAYYKGEPDFPLDAEEYYCSAHCVTKRKNEKESD